MAMARRLAAVAPLLGLALASAAESPTRSFSTFLGLADCDGVAGWKGDIFLACHSARNQLPDGNDRRSGQDAWVVRLNPRTGKLVYALPIGGSAYSAAFRIRVDRDGFAYAAGHTRAKDFPTTPGAVQRDFGGGPSDAFLVRVSPDGRLVYATLLGGGEAEESYGLELDGRGGVFVGGTTWSSDFPGQQSARPAVRGDAFVAHLRTDREKSLRSRVFGGDQEDKVAGVALDGRGGLFAVGRTRSTDFPLAHPAQAALRGASDLFLTRFRVDGLHLTHSTFFGGSGDDSGWGVAVDRKGNPVVAGITSSGDLPAHRDAFQPSARGGLDAFVAQFGGNGYRDIRATYFGGTKDDSSGYDGDNVKVDAAGNVWLVGFTASRDLPTKNSLQAEPGGGPTNGFLAAFSPSLTELCFATYYGGSEGDLLEGLDVTPAGAVLASGMSYSKELPADALVDRAKPASRVNGREVHARLLVLRAAKPCR